MHWDQVGFILGFAGFALHFGARVLGIGASRWARALHAIALALMAVGAIGILTAIVATDTASSIVLFGLQLLALFVAIYFLAMARRSWRSPRDDLP